MAVSRLFLIRGEGEISSAIQRTPPFVHGNMQAHFRLTHFAELRGGNAFALPASSDLAADQVK